MSLLVNSIPLFSVFFVSFAFFLGIKSPFTPCKGRSYEEYSTVVKPNPNWLDKGTPGLTTLLEIITNSKEDYKDRRIVRREKLVRQVTYLFLV